MEHHRHGWKAMGSPCELQLFCTDPREAARGVELAVGEVERLEARYSRFRPDSLLSEINRVAAAGGSLEVDPETASLLSYADSCHAESDGLFDPTSGILRRAWRFESGALPDPAEVHALLGRVGWRRLRWEPPRLAFPEPGLELDLGGVVKEYAADRVVAAWRAAGLGHGMVNLGGDLAILGPRPDGPWRIGIRHPRRRGELLGTLELSQGALASSGDYERCIEIAGQRYGHILSPLTGWPVRHLASVSVVADLCVLAGSAATIAMLREAEGPDWLAASGLPHLWVDVGGNAGGSLDPRDAATVSCSRSRSAP